MTDSFQPQLDRGIALFNEERFYECHDVIEDIWLQESSDQQPFLQGVIQAAVAFHHFQQGKWGAARSMLRLSLEKLSECPDPFRGVRLGPLTAQLADWKTGLDEVLASGKRAGFSRPFPKIERISPLESL